MFFIFLTVIFSEYLDNQLFGYWVGEGYAFGVFLQIHSMRIEGRTQEFLMEITFECSGKN